MTVNPTSESLWDDFEPNRLIQEPDTPAKAAELARTVDNWFPSYIEYIDPFNWKQADKQYFRKKAFIELSAYLLNAQGVANERPFSEIHDLIIDRVNDRRFTHLMLRSSNELHHFYLPFIYAGYVDEIETSTALRLEKVIKQGRFWETERLQYRQQEYCFIFKCFSELFGYSQSQYDANSSLENSLLDNQPNVVQSNLPDAYCLTHDIFFYRNYLGIFPEVFPDEPAPYEIGPKLRGLILRYMAEDNCDIVLELVLAGVLQRQISQEIVRFVLSWVEGKVDDYGYVPGPDQDKKARTNLPEIDKNTLNLGTNEDGDKWDYESNHEKVWGDNYHTNAVAGMTARFIARDWDKLNELSFDHHLEDPAYRRDLTRLGQVLSSLGKYDLKNGAAQLKDLADSPVLMDFEQIAQEAVDFIESQRTLEGEFGYWTREEILYTNTGRTSEDFRSNLVSPISEVCQTAVEAIKTETDLETTT